MTAHNTQPVDEIVTVQRLTEFAAHQLELSHDALDRPFGHMDDAFMHADIAHAHLGRAINILVTRIIRGELRTRFRNAIALELNIQGRIGDATPCTPRRIVGAAGETLWAYHEAFHPTFDDRPEWEQRIEAACARLIYVEPVPEALAVTEPALIL